MLATVHCGASVKYPAFAPHKENTLA